MSTVYEDLSSPEYWETAIEPVPALGWLATRADVWSANSTSVASAIETNFYNMKTGDNRVVLVEPGEELPIIDSERPGLVRVVLDERRRRQLPANSLAGGMPGVEEHFNTQARAIEERRFMSDIPAIMTLPIPDTDQGFLITRSLFYARPGRSGRQLIGVPAASADLVGEEEWGKTPERAKRMIIPQLKVGSTYHDELEGQPRVRRVAHAEIITPLNQVPQRDRGKGGQRVATLSWMRHQARLSAGQA